MTARVVAAENLFDYFHVRVEDARAGNKVRISDDTSLYLASLLADRTRADRVGPTEGTLAELHLHAANSPPSEQARMYRELGDRSLYMLGYFAESLERGTVGPKYYAEMGSGAYHRADRVFKTWFADAFGPVFHELAVRFQECVALVGEVKDADLDDASDDPVWLYQRYLATGSEIYAEKMRAMGLLIVPKRDSGPE